MSQFNLKWSNASVAANPNALSQKASYRQKNLGGDFIYTGFTPANDLSKDVNQTDSPILSDNLVYQFKIEAICAINGPTINDNGVQDIISFLCIVPAVTVTPTSCTVNVNLFGTDIYKLLITVRKTSDNSVVITPTVVFPAAITGIATVVFTGLNPSTNYYLQIEQLAIVNGTEVNSSGVSYLGTPCSPYPFTTAVNPVCNPITSIRVRSIEIP